MKCNSSSEYEGLIVRAQAQVRWVAASTGNVPVGALLAGQQSGMKVFLCRAVQTGSLIAGRVNPANRACSMAHGGREVNQSNYDVAVGNSYSWIPFNRFMEIPQNAVLVGFNAQRQPTYACRNEHTDHLLPGKVEGTFCFISFNTREFRYEQYDLLVEGGQTTVQL